VKVREVISILDRLYPPDLAAPWDNVGLQVGDPNAEVKTILTALDPSEQVIAEAIEAQAQLLITHHPLVLSGINRFTTESSVGRVIAELNSNSLSLFAAHTNADIATGGVNDVLAEALGLTDIEPLLPIAALDGQPQSSRPAKWLKVVVFVPSDYTQSVIDAMADAGAGQIGNYDRCAYKVTGQGSFRPNAGAKPFVGEIDGLETTVEDRVEMVLPAQAKAQVIKALRQASPYEEPAFDIIELVDTSEAGLGRKGALAKPMRLLEFGELVAKVTPKTHHGVRISGDLDRKVKTVGLVTGAGANLLPKLKDESIDVYLTADSKHHVALDNLMANGPALIDIAHWASESPWCQRVADELTSVFTQSRVDVRVLVSKIMGDPWSAHIAGLD
jgi:dinuclear metal center YbgI/SA1388 family protein